MGEKKFYLLIWGLSTSFPASTEGWTYYCSFLATVQEATTTRNCTLYSLSSKHATVCVLFIWIMKPLKKINFSQLRWNVQVRIALGFLLREQAILIMEIWSSFRLPNVLVLIRAVWWKELGGKQWHSVWLPKLHGFSCLLLLSKNGISFLVSPAKPFLKIWNSYLGSSGINYDLTSTIA